MRVAIIGAGWYGAHLALVLHNLGIDVTGFEKSHQMLTETSKNNQLRLHHGLHYLRHTGTRKQTISGFQKFNEIYPEFSQKISRNYYAVPKYESNLDSGTIELILQGSGIPFEDAGADAYLGIKNVEKIIQCDERLILVDRARSYFEKSIGHKFRYGRKITQIELLQLEREFDFVVDATYLGLTDVNYPSVTHEITMMGQFESNHDLFGALTLIDGPLWSIYPTQNRSLWSVSHVLHGVLEQFDNMKDANHFISQNEKNLQVTEKLSEMTSHILSYVPTLESDLQTLIPKFITRKIKPMGNAANRQAEVIKMSEKLLVVQQGKIDAIFDAEASLLDQLQAW